MLVLEDFWRGYDPWEGMKEGHEHNQKLDHFEKIHPEEASSKNNRLGGLQGSYQPHVETEHWQ